MFLRYVKKICYVHDKHPQHYIKLYNGLSMVFTIIRPHVNEYYLIDRVACLKKYISIALFSYAEPIVTKNDINIWYEPGCDTITVDLIANNCRRTRSICLNLTGPDHDYLRTLKMYELNLKDVRIDDV